MSDNPYFLSRGSHATADEGRCAMEWVSYLAGEPHSDSPRCVSPVLMKFCIRLNDALGDERRQRLRPYLARTIGTREDGLDEHRAWLCVDWLVRVYAPAWLSLAGLDGAALRLQALPPILTVEIARCALADLDAARDAVQDAAWAAAGAVVGAATGTVVGAAAQAAAWAVAGAAARDAVQDAAGIAAGIAAGAAAEAAAWAAVGNSTGYAAGSAAGNALLPAVERLQDSAFELLDRMLPTVPVQLPAVEDAALVCGVSF